MNDAMTVKFLQPGTTVRQLIAALSELPPDLPVIVVREDDNDGHTTLSSVNDCPGKETTLGQDCVILWHA